MIILTFVNGVLDINILNTVFVILAVTVITTMIYFVGALIVAAIGAMLS